MPSKKISTKSLNKSAKAAIRQSARDIRASIAAQEKQLRAIERLLDEDFGSLAEAKRELRRNTTQVKRTTKSAKKLTGELAKAFREAFSFNKPTASKSSPISKPKGKPSKIPSLAKTVGNKRNVKAKATPVKRVPLFPPKPIVNTAPRASKPRVQPLPKQTITKVSNGKKGTIKSVRSLRGRSSETTLELFERLEKMGDDPDDLLKDNERWMFTYGNGRAKRLYGTFQQAVSRMYGYKLTQQIVDSGEDEEIDEALVTSIKIVKTSERPGAYADKKEAEEKLRQAERKRIYRAGVRSLPEESRKDISIFGGNIGLADALTKQREADKATIEAQAKEIDKLKGKGKKK